MFKANYKYDYNLKTWVLIGILIKPYNLKQYIAIVQKLE